MTIVKYIYCHGGYMLIVPLDQKSVGPCQDSRILTKHTIFRDNCTLFQMAHAPMRWPIACFI